MSCFYGPGHTGISSRPLATSSRCSLSHKQPVRPQWPAILAIKRLGANAYNVGFIMSGLILWHRRAWSRQPISNFKVTWTWKRADQKEGYLNFWGDMTG